MYDKFLKGKLPHVFGYVYNNWAWLWYCYNIAGHASEAFQESCGFDVEDLCVNVYYWFDKNTTKRKGSLKEFCDFRDEYREVVRYISVRWLSLKKAMHRILQLYQSLQSYFRSEEESQARFGRLAFAFDDPMIPTILLVGASHLHTIESSIATRRPQYFSCSWWD